MPSSGELKIRRSTQLININFKLTILSNLVFTDNETISTQSCGMFFYKCNKLHELQSELGIIIINK